MKKNITLKDDPADHRGILSWHNQKKSIEGPPSLNEAGSYGYLIKVPISKQELENSKSQGIIKLKLQTKGEGGIAIYGESFGRYPLNPSLVFIK